MIAFLREVSRKLGQCELTHLPRLAIESAKAHRQHQQYALALSRLGAEIQWLAPLPDHADGVFVEDTALVLAQVAVILRPGVGSRRGEVASVAAALEPLRPIEKILPPACLEGGDILTIERTLYVGVSARSNAQGRQQLARAVAPFGYEVRPVAMSGCLHLKSACTFIAPHFIVVNPRWVDAQALGRRVLIEVDEHEPFAANTLTIRGTTLVSAAFPQTQKRLNEAGIATHALDISELQKAEGALTCSSLLV